MNTEAQIMAVEESDQNQSSRRKFLISMAGGLGGLFIGFTLPTTGLRWGLSEAEAAILDDPLIGQTIQDVNAWIKISTSGAVELLFGSCEMGQGTMTGLAQLLAEELKVGWDQIDIRRPDTSELPTTSASAKFNYIVPTSKALASTTFWYGTGGSSGISRRWYPLRIAGAQAREVLVKQAMDRQGDTERSHYSVSKGVVNYWNGDVSSQWTYGQLVETTLASVDFSKIDPNTYLTPISAFQIIGQSLPRPDIPLKVNGSAKFGIDVTLPGMVYAAIKHCPTIGGTLGTAPTKPSGALALVPCKALDNRGAIVKDSINAVAIVASDTWTAMKLAKGLSVSWKLPVSTATVDSASISSKATTLMGTSPKSTTPLWLAESRDASGNVTAPINNSVAANADTIFAIETSVNEAINAPGKILQATFSLPYVAHATMEVMNCTASIIFSGTAPVKCEIWAPSQNPGAVQTTAFNYFTALGTPLTKDQIVVHTTFLGGGLGRKIEQDYIYQALQVAWAVKKPVKLTWSREEDSAHDLYRPMALINVKAGLTDSNAVAGFSYRVVTPSISWQRSGIKTSLDLQAVEGAVQSLYNVGPSLTEWVPMDNDSAAIPVGFWRSVGASLNVFAYESMIDMLAQKAGIDPLTFRLKIVSDDRARKILEKIEIHEWWDGFNPSHAWGMAIGKAFGTTVAEVFEISLSSTGSIKIHRVLCVVDCGIVVNPDSVIAQMQGGIIHGINATLYGKTTFIKGVAQQTNFGSTSTSLRMLKLNQAPDIRVEIMKNSFDPTGTGEPGVPPVAPALANAYARVLATATTPAGKRVTSLPFIP